MPEVLLCEPVHNCPFENVLRVKPILGNVIIPRAVQNSSRRLVQNTLHRSGCRNKARRYRVFILPCDGVLTLQQTILIEFSMLQEYMGPGFCFSAPFPPFCSWYNCCQAKLSIGNRKAHNKLQFSIFYYLLQNNLSFFAVLSAVTT